MAISTYGITLGIGSTEITAKVVDIKEFPDLGGAPEEIDVTTFADGSRTSILGIQSQEPLEFTCNYTKTDYQALADIARMDRYYSLSLGVDGLQGTFTWSGQHDVYLTGNGVNTPVEMVVVVMPDSIVRIAHDLTSVTLSGTVKQGVATTALTIVYSPVSPTPSPTITYQWQKSATVGGIYSNIGGATSATYTPVAGDVAAYLRCQVVVGGSAFGTANSNAIVVAAP